MKRRSEQREAAGKYHFHPSFPFFFFFGTVAQRSMRFSNILLNSNVNRDFGGIEQASSAETPACALSNPN